MARSKAINNSPEMPAAMASVSVGLTDDTGGAEVAPMAQLLGTGILPDSEIARLIRDKGMIEGASLEHVGSGVVSYGLSSGGYDFRLSPILRPFFASYGGAPVDPKDRTTSEAALEAPMTHTMYRGKRVFVMQPGMTALGSTVEKFSIPDDVIAITLGKSTYARCGILLNVTPAEPGWSGYLTIEITNLNTVPVILYPYEGIGQMLFFRFASRPNVTYSDRSGKYNNQSSGPVTATVRQ